MSILVKPASNLTFDDEFNSFSTWTSSGMGASGTWDTSRWYAPDGVTGYDGEQQWYVNPAYAPTASANPFSIVDGVLDITAQPATDAVRPFIHGQDYTSGFITTYHSFSQTYGYFEMRAELPAGQGLWPAFWLLPTDNTWPPELDVFEVLGDRPNLLYNSSHTATSGTYVSPGQYKTTGYETVADTSTAFHTYGVDWERDTITWYFDGAAVFQTATPADMNKPMYLIANLAVGGSWPGSPDASTKFPATFAIDYIRAYSVRPTVAATVYDAGATVVSSNVAVAAPVQLGGTVTLSVAIGQLTDLSGGVEDGVSATGTLVKTGGGTLLLDAAGTYTGGTRLDGGILDLAWAKAAGTGPITFADGSGATLTFEAEAQSLPNAAVDLAPTIAGFAGSDVIDLVGVGLASGVAVDAAHGLLTLHDSSGRALSTLHLAGSLTGEVFTVSDDGRGGTKLGLLDPMLHPGAVVIRVSGDAYAGAPAFTVAADGVAVGEVFQAWAGHAAGQYEDVVARLDGPSTVGQVTVSFINDAYGGSAAMDRNLYVQQVTAGGRTVQGTGRSGSSEVPLFSNGSASFSTGSVSGALAVDTATGGLVLSVSEDAYAGDAQFSVSVNGVQQGGVHTVTASHALGQVQEVGVAGSFGAGPLDVAVTFLNDAYGGTPSLDRNLYVSAIRDGSVTTSLDAAFWNGGTRAFMVTDGTAQQQALPDTLTLTLSEDAYAGDAQFTVSVDGVQQGGTRTVTASHGAEASQAFDIAGRFEAGGHAVSVAFLNDAYGGSAGLDRNLYVGSMTLHGTTTAVNAGLYWNGSQTFGV